MGTTTVPLCWTVHTIRESRTESETDRLPPYSQCGATVDKRQISEATTAHNTLAYSNGNCPVLKTERGWKSLWVQILPQAPWCTPTGASSASLADLWMVGAVKVKCLRVRSEGWSPHKQYAVLTELVWCRIANPRSGETLRGFKSLRPRQQYGA